MKNIIDVIHALEKARTANVLASIAIIQNCSKDCHSHAEELQGAADMIQTWIEHLRNEV